MKKHTIQKSNNGFFLLDFRAKKVIQNYSHEFSYYLYKNLEHAFAEDKELEKIWNQSDFSGNKNQEFLNLIREASEYYVLDKLSTHIETELEDSSIDKTRIFDRTDIAELLATNRFLNLFSKPIAERPLFSSGTRNDQVACCENGAMFRRVALQLPKNSKIKRDRNNSFTIRNRWFSLNVKTIFEGYMTALPLDFCEVYLGLKKAARHYPALSLKIEIKATFRLGFLMSRTGKQYCSILHMFASELEKAVDKDYYFDQQLQWEQSRVILEILERRNAKDRVEYRRT